jgi:SNW domain-containing protein 1
MVNISILFYIFKSNLILAKDTSDIYGDDLDRIISTNRFVADKGFSGTEGGGGARSGPVQFEKDEEDIFGLGQLLESGKESKKRQAESGGAGESSSSSKRSRR